MTSSETTFNDEELIARLRLPWPIIDSVEEVTLPVWVLELGAAAADRIEALVKHRDAYAEMERLATEALRKSEARAEQLEAALMQIAGKPDYADDPWSIARAALKGAAHD